MRSYKALAFYSALYLLVHNAAFAADREPVPVRLPIDIQLDDYRFLTVTEELKEGGLPAISVALTHGEGRALDERLTIAGVQYPEGGLEAIELDETNSGPEYYLRFIFSGSNYGAKSGLVIYRNQRNNWLMVKVPSDLFYVEEAGAEYRFVIDEKRYAFRGGYFIEIK